MLRQVDRSKYPELGGYTKAEIWRDIGPGGLYLVSRLAKTLDLPGTSDSGSDAPGSHSDAWVLDLGCGMTESSLYLAEHYQVKVVAADLKRPARWRSGRSSTGGNTGPI